MALTKKCPLCEGTKKVSTLGGMKIDCKNCKGVGYIKIEPEMICASPSNGKKKKEKVNV